MLCNGYAIGANIKPNYLAPFRLSMTIQTSSLQLGNGGILNDHSDSSLVSISWLEAESSESESKIKIIVTCKDSSESDGTRITQALNKSQKYDLEINFKEHISNVFLNGEIIGDPIRCEHGLKELGSPELCYTVAEGKWIGSITNLKVESFEGKQRTFFLPFYYT